MNAKIKTVESLAEVKPHPMTTIEMEVLANRIKSMDMNELEIVADNIPIELCFKRVEKEILKYRTFAEATKGAIDILNN